MSEDNKTPVIKDEESDVEDVNMQDDSESDTNDENAVMNLQSMINRMGEDGENEDDEGVDDEDDEDEDGDYEDEDEDEQEIDMQELLMQYFENEERENIPTVLSSIKFAIDNNSKAILKLVSEVKKMREETQKVKKGKRA